ncbi:prepilin-type N-terminal cleavage/methylation domain-containing protein [Bacillus toyonensis]|nr:prepilin-type N-terminal cleavage/methylation domain-containing protein [Bacillus toyonensis]
MFLCGRKNKLEVGFTLIEMIVCLFLVSLFFLLLPSLHFIGMENKHSKGLNEWEWDVFLGQRQLIVSLVFIVISVILKPVDI